MVGESADGDVDFFEKRIRPALVQHCYKCHSAKAKAAGKLKGGLRLDTRVGIQTGGETGAAIVPGDADKSLLIRAIRYGEKSLQMPPDGKLSGEVLADFEKWIGAGAVDPREGESPVVDETGIDWEESRRFWSLQAPKRYEAPSVKQSGWVRKPLDAFILRRHEEVGLVPAAEADRKTLLRRVCLDLCGLPPTFEEMERFLSDESPDAYARMVDRQLARVQYGERWGRHWLDVARYAEDNTNMGPHNGPYKHAWRYRDWVVQTLNDDVPYDEFIVRQLATDFLPETGPEDHAALGFQGLAPSYHKEVALAKVELENRYADEWEDRVDLIGRGLLGLTLACARCHDHKYDPVTMEDYYALAGVFASSRQTTRPIISDEEVAKTQPARDKVAALEKQVAEWQKQIKAVSKEVGELEKKLKRSAKTPEPAAGDSSKPAAFDAEVTTARKELAAVQQRVAEASAAIAELKKTAGFVVPVADALTEEQVRVEEIDKARMKIVYYPNRPRDLNIFVRGAAHHMGPLVRRRFLQVFSPEKPRYFDQGSGRLELARAIASQENPLTARVMVNRVWMQHFGVGLVDTPSDFGGTGSLPSHPELLDDLTVRFVDAGWSLKWLHREIVLSATYQQSTRPAELEAGRTKDPDNRLLSHFNRRRLDAEAFRDALLASSGLLEKTVGGPSGDADDADFRRRSIYAAVSRHKLSDMLQTFDFPDPAIHCARRAETTTPLQQMFVLNSPFVRRQAIALAERLVEQGGSTRDERVRFAHRVLFGREPTATELRIAGTFLSRDEHTSAVKTGDLADAEMHEAPTFEGARLRARVKGLGDAYTVELWLRNTLAYNARPVTGYFFSRGLEQPANDHGEHVGISGSYKNAPGRLIVYNGAGHRQTLTGKTVLPLNEWQHVAFVREGESIRVYLNGRIEPEIQGTAARGYKPGVDQVFVGGRLDNFANFQGQMQEVAIYNRALVPEDISKHVAASGLPGKAHVHTTYASAVMGSQPLAYWPLLTDKPSSGEARDASSHANHGQYEGRAGGGESLTPWQRYAHALLSSNEFLYVD
ncbi:MAG: hypothetical protein CMJ48_14910 [Planctomycetaceae bacterium]|nr:hypothetical protein [Planctomycetaceae bacterium]